MTGRMLKFLLSLLFMAAPLLASAQTEHPSRARIPVRTLDEKELAYQAGEHLKYRMHYRWGLIDSNIGHAEVQLDTARVDGKRCFHCTVSGRTTRLYDLVFQVRENFQSWFTCDGLRPMKFLRDSHEGPYVSRNRYSYRWDAEVPVIDADIFTTGGGSVTKAIPLDDCTFDLPALFFFARNMDFGRVVPGKKHPMTFVVDDDVYDVHFILYGPETIKVNGLGKIRTLKFGAKLIAGEVFTGEEDMLVWISDDENRIPVYFEAPILVGTASGWLTDWSGLKHEFSSRVSK